MKRLEQQSYRAATRLGRRPIRLYAGKDKTRTGVWSNYSFSRDIPVPVQKMPKVGHFSVPKGER